MQAMGGVGNRNVMPDYLASAVGVTTVVVIGTVWVVRRAATSPGI